MKNKIWLTFLAIMLVASLVAFGACAKEEEAPPVAEAMARKASSNVDQHT